MTTALPVTMETYGKVQSVDPSGRAWALYCFYVRAAVNQQSSQPLCTDQFCKNGLRWGSVNTVVTYRKMLMEAQAITHFKKQSYHYVRVHHMTVDLPNGRFELSETPIRQELLGTYEVFKFWGEWWERLHDSCFDEFVKRVKKEVGTNAVPDYDTVYGFAEQVYDRMQQTAKRTLDLDTELRFWTYLIAGVKKEITRKCTPNVYQ